MPQEEEEALIRQDAILMQQSKDKSDLYKREARKKALDFAMVEIREGRSKLSLTKTAEEIYLWLMGETK